MTTTKTKKNAADKLREELTAAVVAAIESDEPTRWAQEWVDQIGADGMPYNATTGRRYNGGNVLWLLMTAMSAGYASNAWATYKQWQAAGAQVRRGEHGTFCLFWKRTEREDPDTGQVKQSMFARTFTVFNVAQVDVVDPDTYEAKTHGVTVAAADPTDSDPLAPWFDAIPAKIVPGQPAYSRSFDHVSMPPADAFTTRSGYWSTLGHELAHWTGHPDRLNRTRHQQWGDDAYAFEELVAELAAAFICGHHGIEHETRDNHVQYLAHWARRFRDNPQTLWTAATRASAAFEHLAAYSDRGEQ